MAAKNAISVAHFAEHFRLAWSGVRGIVPHGRKSATGDVVQLPQRIGLAVSGGADSMALAYLARQLELTPISGPISVTAFVVDHRARPESGDEAKTVSSWLTDMGIDTQILKLDWSQFSNNLDSSAQNNAKISMPTAFETHARRLRYQALGTACRKKGIDALLMGHHRDDSIETTIWRLATGGRRAGLGGIQSIARIPECHGLFGVSESGSSVRLPEPKIVTSQSTEKSAVPSARSSQKGTRSASKNPAIATGGIFLCRPLISFSKVRLLETCHQNNIPYVSDPTNFDPTLTPRNAIRSMLASNSLPRALQGPRILSLIRSSRDLLQVSSSLSDQLLSSRCRILDINLRTGTMTVQFRQIPPWMDPMLAQTSPERAQQIQALTLRRITELVSPFPGNHFSLRSFEPFVSRIFGPVDERHVQKDTAPKQFTLGGVMFTPVPSSPTQSPSGGNTWLFSRQPFMKNRSPVTSMEIPMPTPKELATDSRPRYSQWTLWDDRYWLRLSITPQGRHRAESISAGSKDSVSFTIRPLQEPDFQTMRNEPVSKGRKNIAPALLLTQLRKLLSAQAPGPARFTLPVLLQNMDSPILPETQEGNKLLALPVLGFPLSGVRRKENIANEVEIIAGGRTWVLNWEWMYKMLDTDALRLMGRPVEAKAASVQ
ncbi:hypothetical protein N7466_002320 [Penicillium verhagenii]|uniref:uncharacterized protein n=1 Tax=Penicillium verhagenii TaxID=1562060 RepID=UPI002545AC83|nr:uncharacterized protein N7466_002320 [Penicillium verhagenii]KAJ5939186.1 hypothetical protein N7466_002320 [Penicillium verhagenii]